MNDSVPPPFHAVATHDAPSCPSSALRSNPVVLHQELDLRLRLDRFLAVVLPHTLNRILLPSNSATIAERTVPVRPWPPIHPTWTVLPFLQLSAQPRHQLLEPCHVLRSVHVPNRVLDLDYLSGLSHGSDCRPFMSPCLKDDIHVRILDHRSDGHSLRRASPSPVFRTRDATRNTGQQVRCPRTHLPSLSQPCAMDPTSGHFSFS